MASITKAITPHLTAFASPTGPTVRLPLVADISGETCTRLQRSMVGLSLAVMIACVYLHPRYPFGINSFANAIADCRFDRRVSPRRWPWTCKPCLRSSNRPSPRVPSRACIRRDYYSKCVSEYGFIYRSARRRGRDIRRCRVCDD